MVLCNLLFGVLAPYQDRVDKGFLFPLHPPHSVFLFRSLLVKLQQHLSLSWASTMSRNAIAENVKVLCLLVNDSLESREVGLSTGLILMLTAETD